MMLFYYGLIGVLVATAAAKTNATDGVGIKSETKDKRQVNQHTRVLGYQAGVSAQPTPSPTQTVYGHHSAGQYVTRPQQPAESEQQQQHQNDPEQLSSPEYYNFVQGLVLQQQQHQQQQPQQQDTSGGYQSAARGHTHYTTAPAEPQPQYQYLTQADPASGQAPHQTQILTEAEYLELIKKTESQNLALTQKYGDFQASQGTQLEPQQPAGLGNYKKAAALQRSQQNPAKEVQSGRSASVSSPQSYLQSYVNPLGDFSLEKELAKLEESNKAVVHHGGGYTGEDNESDDRHQTDTKPQKYAFKPSLQLNIPSGEGHQPQPQQKPQQPQYSASFAVPTVDYGQYSNEFSPQPQKLVAHYAAEESVNTKSVEQPEYQIQYLQPSESPNRYLPEAIEHRQHQAAAPPSPRYQYYHAGAEKPQVAQPQHAGQQQSPQLQITAQEYELLQLQHQQQQQQQQQEQHKQQQQPQQHQQHPQKQHLPHRSNPVKIIQAPQLQYERPQHQQHQQQQQHNQQLSSEPQSQHYKSQQSAKQHVKLPHITSPEGATASRSAIYVSQATGIKQTQPQRPQPIATIKKEQKPVVRLPPPDQKRPLTQAEFQALVDAGYKVQAIPVPVPVPIITEKYSHQLSQPQHQPQPQHQHQPQPQHQHQSQPQHQHQSQPQHQHHQLQQIRQQYVHQTPQQQSHHHQQSQQQDHQQPPQQHRPQPSNKHYVRYQQPAATDDSLLQSYLRPLIEQYSSLMGGGKGGA